MVELKMNQNKLGSIHHLQETKKKKFYSLKPLWIIYFKKTINQELYSHDKKSKY